MAEWSEELCLQLIELYQNNPMLWNPKDEYYYKNNKKLDAWSRIASELDKDAESCKTIIISLLASYRREKKKENKSKGTGKGASQVYVSRWFAIDAMRFLDDRDKPRKRLNTTDKEEPETETVEKQTETVEEQSEREQKKITQPPVTPQPKQRKYNHDGNRNELIKNAVAVLKSVNDKIDAKQEVSKDNINTATKAFTNFLAMKMDSYSAQTKMGIQHAIFDIIMKADMGHFEFSINQYSQETYTTCYHTTAYRSTQDTSSPSTSRASSQVNHPSNQSRSEFQSESSVNQPLSSFDTLSTASDCTEDFGSYV